jgi:disulfide bond formation protein DsbB
MEMQQLFSFALLSSNAIFRTATNTINVFRSSRKMRHIVVRFEFIGASRQIYMKAANIKFHENPSNGIRADTCETTDARKEMAKVTGTFREFSTKTLKMYPNLFALYTVLCFQDI